jgi:hypothetical protein
MKNYSPQARIQDSDLAHLLEVDPQSRVVFAQGWIEGVLSIWQVIKTQVESHPSIANSNASTVAS